MSKHTPGPWYHRRWQAGAGENVYAEHNGKHIAQIFCVLAGDENEANARLIAAAPDMLACCKEVRNAMRYVVDLEKGTHTEQMINIGPIIERITKLLRDIERENNGDGNVRAELQSDEGAPKEAGKTTD